MCKVLSVAVVDSTKMSRVRKKAKDRNNKVRDMINIKFGIVVMVGAPGRMEGDAV